MPIYEYICNQCGKHLNFLVLNRDTFTPVCNKCQSTDVRKIMSKFRAVESEESRMDRIADPGKWGDLDENDPKSMVKFMKKMGKEMGDEMGEDYDQMIQEAEEEAEKLSSDKSSDSGDDELITQ
jgi:putative FmdB family regulatory protein